ncbi:Na-translocating system protein MpsC family protein [Paenibacillus anseongense]|uniref:Na-translocating system protein MpsC family protein n=1 Tax=Paenibacillus anseongense TaxID=2682845 RepID=UPI002DBD40A8|nr:Na-translocating system protein MpsC family protein [Paenibacillus anseongense]
MNNTEKLMHNELAGHVGRLLREAFGKGPESIFVSINRPFAVIYLRSFLSATEKILLQQDKVFSILNTRDLVMKSLIPEIKAYLLLLTGMQIREFYYDWDLHNHSGVMVVIESDDSRLHNAVEESYTGKEALHKEIDTISYQVQKSPEELYSFMINERTLLVIRNGILISIEKELIRIGHEESLKLAKRNLEKSRLHNNSHFSAILNLRVLDVFVDWDFDLDRSVITFILNPSR